MQTTTPALDLRVLEAISRELFDSVSVERETDPEIPGLDTLVFNVTAHGDVADVSERRQEWHRRTQAVLGEECDRVQLAIDILSPAVWHRAA